MISHLSEIAGETTAHGSGLKQVFRKNDEMQSRLTQIAFGTMKKGEGCEKHIHPTMDEYFFFIEGSGIYIIDDINYEVEPGMFLEILAGTPHSLEVTSKQPLKFVYWGAAR